MLDYTYYMLLNQEQPYILPICDEPLQLIFEDEAIIVVNKPSGLLSQPGKHPLNQDSVLLRLRQLYPQAELAHRLDLDTSGVLIAGTNRTHQAQLNRQFAERDVKKSYTALVTGLLSEASQGHKGLRFTSSSSGIIDIPIGPDLANKPKQKIDWQYGKSAISHFERIDYCSEKNISRTILSPYTGRSHQLRLHCQAIGHAILGCDLYADEATYLQMPRLALHAHQLKLKHPVTQESLCFNAAAPF